MTTPRTMMPTFPRTFMLGGAIPKAQVANRVTTALVAYLRTVRACSIRVPGPRAASTCLEHLDEGDGEVKVGNVSADQTQAEHDTDGDNGAPWRPYKSVQIPTSVIRAPLPAELSHHSHVGLSVHGNLVPRIKGGSALGHDLGHGGRKHHVPCCQEEGCSIVSGGVLVEAGLARRVRRRTEELLRKSSWWQGVLAVAFPSIFRYEVQMRRLSRGYGEAGPWL